LRRLDRLVLKEMFGPWLFGVGIFTVLIFAATYLLSFTELLAAGAGLMLVIKLTALTLPAILAKTFSMAMLLAALLAFGRLSSDSEVVAMRAAGSSIGRIMVPVAWFGLFAAVLTFWFQEQVVPFASSQALNLRADLEGAVRGATAGPTAVLTRQGDKQLLITATQVLVQSRIMKNAQVTVFDEGEPYEDVNANDRWDSTEPYTDTNDNGIWDSEVLTPTATLYAGEMQYTNEKDWKIRGKATIVVGNTFSTVENAEPWSEGMPQPDMSIEDAIMSQIRNPDQFTMKELSARIEKMKQLPQPNRKQIANLEYMYYNKVSVPLAALVFALVGAPLGIRNHRTGAASGFWVSVLIIFCYMMLANFMAVYAQGGVLPPYLASFTPLVIGLLVAAVTIHRKN
jgi:lipopolysaccharide export system permease protein